jgi:aldehyde:ferredoxin oxidoreductase
LLGFAGRLLDVNLSSSTIHERVLPESLVKTYIGGRGVNAKLLYDMLSSDVDPLSPKNVLIIGSGALTCTTAPSSGRITVTCKSPATNLYLKSSVGGHVGSELKFAGYDFLIIRGAAEKPQILVVRDREVELQDASHLWGMGVKETNQTIKKDLSDIGVKVACIGPAGESLVPFGSIMFSVYHAAARGGAGAVMGSKNLKAIAVRGTGEITIANPTKFAELSQILRTAFRDDMNGRKYFLFGTGTFDSGPAYNFLREPLESSDIVSGPYLLRKHYLKRHIGCFGCTQSCHRYTEIDSGPYEGTYTLGPEYETFSALGAGIGIIDPETVIKINDVVGDLGMDSISTGVTLEWAMESFEKGVLNKEDTDGLELNFGNDEAVLEVIPKIARREGRIGQLLSLGLKRASAKLGKESYKWAMVNSKGLEQSKVDTRIVKSYALAFAVNPRGPDHLHTECMAAWGGSGAARGLIERITGKHWPEAAASYPEIVKWHEQIYAASDSIGFCAFTCTAGHAILEREMAELYSLATGYNVSAEKLMDIGERIVTLERCFNIREGADRKLDNLPWRMMNEPVSWGKLRGMVSSKEWLDEMLDQYYTLHGWDIKTGSPKKESLQALGLATEAEQLERKKEGSSRMDRGGE